MIKRSESLCFLFQMVVQIPVVLSSQVRASQVSRLSFQHDSHIIIIRDKWFINGHDNRASVRTEFHQVFRFQSQKGFSDRHPGNPQLLGQQLLAQFLAWFIYPFVYQSSQQIYNLLPDGFNLNGIGHRIFFKCWHKVTSLSVLSII